MSLGKAMIHARKQKSIARAAGARQRNWRYAVVQSTHILQMPVLVLNASYEPINICGARRALVLVLKGIARTEEEHGLTLHAQRSRIAMPSVIRLLEYRRIPHQTRALSRKNILLRDRNTCQYCGDRAALRRTHPRPRHSALARRQLHVGKSRRLLPRLQSPQRQPHARGNRRHDPAARAASLLAPHQPPDHAHARPRRRPLAQIPLLLNCQYQTFSECKSRHHLMAPILATGCWSQRWEAFTLKAPPLFRD